MIVMPGSGLRDAATLVERIRLMIENTPIHWGGLQIKLTASFGLATWPMTPASAPEELISAADRALYASKENGRNQIHAMLTDQPISYAAFMAEAASDAHENA